MTSRPGRDEPATPPARVIDAIEFQSAVLVRNLEMIRRRGDFYLEVDRAGYLLLRLLDSLGPADITTLAAALGLDPSTTGRQVAAAETAGLIRRSAAPEDRRRQIITLTPAGTAAMTAVRHRRREGTIAMLEHWNAEDLRTLASVFTRYNEAIVQRYTNLSTMTGEPRVTGQSG